MKKYASIDIGGTAIKYGMIDEEARFLTRGEMKTEAWKGGLSILEKTRTIIKSMNELEKISGICISTAGIVDTIKGEIRYSSPLIPGYTGIKYKEVLEEEFAVPCEVENDVNCAGLAEYMSGAARDSRISLMLTVGTGIGGSVIINGKIFHGENGGACEVGYMHMDDSDFQTLASARTLTKKVAKWKGEPEDQWDGYHIFEQAKKGDKLCLLAIDEMVDVLGQGIANICYVLNPDIVVLGGGIMAQKEFLREKIETALKKYLISGVTGDVHLAFAEHGNDAGKLGAFYHFKQCQER